jgi:hypothetical protein
VTSRKSQINPLGKSEDLNPNKKSLWSKLSKINATRQQKQWTKSAASVDYRSMGAKLSAL